MFVDSLLHAMQGCKKLTKFDILCAPGAFLRCKPDPWSLIPVTCSTYGAYASSLILAHGSNFSAGSRISPCQTRYAQTIAPF